jgi:ubiquitin conjugation factor E4 B
MQFMRYVIVWTIRLVSAQYPKKALELPLPSKQPEVFGSLPEYFIEDVIDNFKFITRHVPHILVPTQVEEIVHFCIAFLRSSEYIKNPGLKVGICSILYHGTWPIRGRAKGVLGDNLNDSTFAMKHLMHSLLKAFIEVESTGTHNQFYDKFTARWEIFHVIRCIWSNPIYRKTLGKESLYVFPSS